MKEYIIWARRHEEDSAFEEQPISEGVFDATENERRVQVATANGWKHIRTQVIDYAQPYNPTGDILKAIKI